jgi:hypothetical protein
MAVTNENSVETVTVTDSFPPEVTVVELDGEVQLRLTAKALSCTYEQQSGGWLMTTTWRKHRRHTQPSGPGNP